MTELQRITNANRERYGISGPELRAYQLDGINWLIKNYQTGHGSLLGDEMGVGKTCQAICFLSHVRCQIDGGHFLVVCPLSVLQNWQEEFALFSRDNLQILTYIGDKDKRSYLQNKILSKDVEFDVIVTTYQYCLRDSDFLSHLKFDILIVDEGHTVKNCESQIHQMLIKFKCTHKVLLTGTPVQNDLRELHSLISFVSPNDFPPSRLDEFVCHYESVSSNKQLADELHLLLEPHLLRRLKSDVLGTLPQKDEVTIYLQLTQLQKKYYKAILLKDAEVFEAANSRVKTRLVNILMQLRKCVNHPYLFDRVEPEPFVLGEHLIEASGKLIVIDRLLSYLSGLGHRVLLFSQMTRMLDILQDYLYYRGYSYERLDGSVRGEERFLAMNKFNKSDDTFVFLLSTKAGGQGLNLTSADTVIFVDSDLNPQNDIQAAARAHRIGQTKCVRVIRLVCRSTVEEVLLRRAELKLQLTNAVVASDDLSFGTDLAVNLQDVLKYGVNDLLSATSSEIEAHDFTQLLGDTVDGMWQPMTVDTKSSETHVSYVDKRNGDTIYMYEGKDYSYASTEDNNALQAMLARVHIHETPNALSERRARRGASEFIPSTLQHKVQLTDEEKKDLQKRRAEAKVRRQEQQELERKLANSEQEKRKQELWLANSYASCSIGLVSDSDSGSDTDETESKYGSSRHSVDIQYVRGDVTHPTVHGDTAIVVHCVDDSGIWGRGGIFRALDQRSSKPQRCYQFASQMKDLALGDVHLVEISYNLSGTAPSPHSTAVFVALCVVQHRNRQGNISEIQLDRLTECLCKIQQKAKLLKASVHLPRIGYNTSNFNWYATEHLIRKHITLKQVQAVVYYYPRQKRQTSVDNESTSGPSSMPKQQKRDEDAKQHASKPFVFNNFLRGVVIYFHNLSEEQVKKFTRYVVAFAGDVSEYTDENVTHIIVDAPSVEVGDIRNYDYASDYCCVVQLKWLEDCLKCRKRLAEYGKYKATIIGCVTRPAGAPGSPSILHR